MSNLPVFGEYAAAFEASLKDDDWNRLKPYFTEDASYQPGDGTHARGRDAVLAALKASVDALERHCDSRELVGEPEVSETGDTVTLKFTLRYTKQGSPDLLLTGDEILKFSDGAIQTMEDVFEEPETMIAWRSNL